MRPPAMQGIHHVALICSDYKRSKRFYSETLGLPILAAFVLYYQRPIDPLELLWLPVIVLVQLILSTGLALFLSALTVHFRDLKDLLKAGDNRIVMPVALPQPRRQERRLGRLSAGRSAAHRRPPFRAAGRAVRRF